MQMSLLQWALAISAFVLQLGIILIMTMRKLRTTFPVFFHYIVFLSLGMILLVVGAQYSSCTSPWFLSTMFYGYWTLTIISMLLSFGILYEVFVNALRPYSAVIDLGKLLFVWAAIFLVAAAVLTAVATSDSQYGKVAAAVLLIRRSLRLMQCGLLMFLVIFEAKLGLSWRSHGFCIAFGLGIYAAFNLIGSYLTSSFPSQQPLVDNLDGLAFLSVLAFWAVRLRLPEPAHSTAAESPKRLILQRWNEALASHGYGQPASASSTVESFLPGIEKTVDRVMARKAVS